MVRKRFITPAEIPEEDICRGLVLPNSRDWLGVFSEALSQTIYPYNYEQINETDLTPEDAAAEAYERYTAWLDAVCASGGVCVLPGGQRIYRTKKVSESQTVYQYLENEEWIDDEDIPPTPAREEPTDEEKTCAAASNAVNVLYLTWVETSEYYEASVAAQDAQVDTAIFISGLIGTFFYPPIAGLFVLAQAGWEIVYYAYEIVTAVDWDESFSQKLICAFIEHATVTEGVVTFDIQQVLYSMWSLAFTGQAYLTIMAQLEYMINQIGAPAIDAAGALDLVEDPICSCGNWTRTWTYAEMYEGEEWVKLQGILGLSGEIIPTGTWVGTWAAVACDVVVPAETTIMQVKAWYFVPSTASIQFRFYKGATSWVHSGSPDDAPYGGTGLYVYSNPSYHTDSWEAWPIEAIGDDTEWRLSFSLRTAKPNSSLKGISISGSGPCPFTSGAID